MDNEYIFNYLKKSSEEKTLSHAYSFISPECENKLPGLLIRFVLFFMKSKNLVHPDIKIIEPKDNVIKISAIREAKTWASMSPISSDKKILIIKSARLMNAEAQNAFLKLLEEPDEKTYIFLGIGHKRQILPTVYSRVSPIYLFEEKKDKVSGDYVLIKKILSTNDTSERIRIWIEAKLEKDQIFEWIKNSIPLLRDEMIRKKSKKIAVALQNIINLLSSPIGQNWKIVAENLIITI